MITAIKIYREGNTWLFDEGSLGIHREAFVCGASEAIDILLGEPCVRATLTFGDEPFPNAAELHFDSLEFGGAHYYLGDHPLWLCSCLYAFFQQAPISIWVSARKEKEND